MAEETNFIPRKVTNPNDFLDRKSYLCICNVFCNSRAITDEIKYHDKPYFLLRRSNRKKHEDNFVGVKTLPIFAQDKLHLGKTTKQAC